MLFDRYSGIDPARPTHMCFYAELEGVGSWSIEWKGPGFALHQNLSVLESLDPDDFGDLAEWERQLLAQVSQELTEDEARDRVDAMRRAFLQLDDTRRRFRA